MPWYTVSLDQVLAQEEKHRKEHIEPVSKVVEFLDYVLSQLLESLGVDCSQPKEIIGLQQQRLNIHVLSLDTPEDVMTLCRAGNYRFSAKVMGFYIFQNMEAKFFIQNPYIKNGRVCVDFYSFDKNAQIGTGEVKVPLQ